MQRDRIVVAGGTGFHGSHLCERLLDDGAAAVALDKFRTGTPATLAHLTERRPFRLIRADAMHTHDHVLEELRLYSDLVGEGSYIVAFDTVIADMPGTSFLDRPWSAQDNPKTAVHAFLSENDRFVIDEDLEAKLQITVAPSGYLRCVR